MTSETSVRRTKRRGRVGELSDGKSSGSLDGGEEEEEEEEDFEDSPMELDQMSDEPAPRRKRHRGAGTGGFQAARVLDEGYSLIEVIRHEGHCIPLAVKRWVEQYEKSPKSAMAELLMMFFEACGATYHLNASTLDEINVDSVVLSLVGLARDGKVEDHYTSKAKDFKNFKENLSTFWDILVIECKNGPLFDKMLFDKCTDYIIAMSCTPPRVYRQIASLVGLQLVTSIITVAKTLGGQRETTQRQLNAEKKKRNDECRVESLTKRLSLTHEKITAAEEMMRKIFTGLFMHRYRDVDHEIRTFSIKALGVWIVSYPSLFLKDSYLKYLGWTLNDKNAGVRKTSVQSLQSLYEVDDNVPSLGLFTERFSGRMIELADDIEISVAVASIGLIKLLLRHQLLPDDELGPLYDLLIDEPPLVRRAIGELVYDHLIVQKVGSSRSGFGGSEEPSEIHLGRMLQILREFPDDPILSSYVIDDVWDNMKAMKDWKCIISMLLDENTSIELTDADATNLIRVLYASAKKAVGEKIVPAQFNRKPYLSKAQKEVLDNNRRDLTLAMLKSYPQLLRKYAADKTKVSPLIEISALLKLELYSLKREEQSFKAVVEIIYDAFFKHSDKNALRSCAKAMTFCSTECQADLQDFAQNKLKELEDELIVKLNSAMKEVESGNDEYSLLVNLKRLYELQLTRHVSNDSIFEVMARTPNHLDDEVMAFLLLNMYLHVVWSLYTIDKENPNEASMHSLLSKRNSLFERLDFLLNFLPEIEGKTRQMLASRVCVILAEMWCLFKKSKYSSTKMDALGYYPNVVMLQKFWKLCEKQLNVSDDTEDEDANDEYIEETSRDVVMVAAAKLVVNNIGSEDYLHYLGSEIISHFVMHGPSIAEIIKHLISVLKKTNSDYIPTMYLEALKKAYKRHMVDLSIDNVLSSDKSFSECKDLANRLSASFIGAARNKHKSHILQITKDGVAFAFEDIPNQLSFLEAAVLPFVSKLPTSDAIEILKYAKKMSNGINTDEDPSSWRPYHTFVDHLIEKYAKNELNQELNVPRRHVRRRKTKKSEGRKLFQDSSDDDFISDSDQSDHGNENDDDEQPIIHTFKSASKFQSMKLSQQGKKDKTGSSKSPGGTD